MYLLNMDAMQKKTDKEKLGEEIQEEVQRIRLVMRIFLKLGSCRNLLTILLLSELL